MTARSLAWVLIVIALGQACGRILSTQLVLEPNVHRATGEPPRMGRAWPAERPRPMPTFGSNDRSRWATIRSLVDEGTYVIGKRDLNTMFSTMALHLAAQDVVQGLTIYQAGYYLRTRTDPKTGNNTGIIFDDGWQSVDKVLNPSTQEFYSSKPPLVSTLLAGLYWLLRLLTGWTLANEPEAVVRTMLILVNGLTFVLYLHVLSRIGERYAQNDWSRLMVLAAAAFGTMVTPFLITLNNHTLGTFCVLWATAHALTIWERRQDPQKHPAPWLHYVMAGLLASFAVCNELPALAFWAGLLGLFFLWSPSRALCLYLPPSLVVAGAFFYTNYQAVGQLAPAYSTFGSPWYEYEASHWRKPEPGEVKTGIDWAHLQETRGEYATHLLVGHHGFFSLTPIWLLALAGALLYWRRREEDDVDPTQTLPTPLPWWLPLLTLGLTVVVVGFYLFKSDNYGGWTNGPRWLMWLSPLLLICLLPLLDRLSTNRVGRGVAYLCLLMSILSANYRAWNPWRHPWIYDLMVWLGWPGY